MVNVHAAKTHLSKLLEQVARGEEVIIARSGKPVARLVPFDDRPRVPGRLRGEIEIRPDFDDPLPAEVLAGFHGDRD